MKTFSVASREHTQFISIDGAVQRLVAESGISSGVCHVFVPHTTAGLTINENADPCVCADIRTILERLIPWQGGYTHAEGNAAAHLKASMMGFSVTVLIESGHLALGTWQSLYLCEFDGPRTRNVWVQIVPA